MEAVLPNSSGNRSLFPVARQQSALSEIAEQWEQLVLGVVNVAGCMSRRFCLSTPYFQFSAKPKFENLETLNCFVHFSVVCFGPQPAFRRRRPQR